MTERGTLEANRLNQKGNIEIKKVNFDTNTRDYYNETIDITNYYFDYPKFEHYDNLLVDLDKVLRPYCGQKSRSFFNCGKYS
ncbi:MAG: hypothetical protein Q4A81_07510 [Pasteurellaceae bacterium]|nr:hypothetical protein [Pasteurellaceae bacterium]